MPIPLPNLDDRSYADLTGEARALLPALLPEWTDHNPSDPGIVLVELLAWVTDMLLYQVDQVPDGHVEGFLALLGAPRQDGVSLDSATRAAVLDLREHYRAVTVRDHEELVRVAWPADEVGAGFGPGGGVARVRCLPGRNLAAPERPRRAAPAPGSVSLLVVPPRAAAGAPPQPAPELLAALRAFFEPRRLVATRLHVVGPRYVPVGVAADLALRADALPGNALADAMAALAAFFDPLTGGPDGTGWPFGRPVRVSEVAAVLTGLPLVDYVEEVALHTADPARHRGSGGSAAVVLDDDELVTITADGLVAFDPAGKRYPGA